MASGSGRGPRWGAQVDLGDDPGRAREVAQALRRARGRVKRGPDPLRAAARRAPRGRNEPERRGCDHGRCPNRCPNRRPNGRRSRARADRARGRPDRRCPLHRPARPLAAHRPDGRERDGGAARAGDAVRRLGDRRLARRQPVRHAAQARPRECCARPVQRPAEPDPDRRRRRADDRPRLRALPALGRAARRGCCSPRAGSPTGS